MPPFGYSAHTVHQPTLDTTCEMAGNPNPEIQNDHKWTPWVILFWYYKHKNTYTWYVLQCRLRIPSTRWHASYTVQLLKALYCNNLCRYCNTNPHFIMTTWTLLSFTTVVILQIITNYIQQNRCVTYNNSHMMVEFFQCSGYIRGNGGCAIQQGRHITQDTVRCRVGLLPFALVGHFIQTRCTIHLPSKYILFFIITIICINLQ